MGERRWPKRTHSKRFFGDSNDDWYDYEVQTSEVFVGASLAGGDDAHSGFSFAEQGYPTPGATGHQRIGVHWWFDGTLMGGPGSVSYFLTAKSEVSAGVPGKVIVFEDRDFEGASLVVSGASTNSMNFNDKISSLVVLKGNWTFFRDADYLNPYLKGGRPITLPPGLYTWVEDVGIANDSISSLRCVLDPPNY